METFHMRPMPVADGGRTLLDMLREEEKSGRRRPDHVGVGMGMNRIHWRGFKDRLRLRRPNNGGDDRSGTFSPPEMDEMDFAEGGAMSLMALMEQTDNHGPRDQVPIPALLGGEYAPVQDKEVEWDREEDEAKVYVKCCVCMERHKGAAFIPCGHTFCRLCSRELWVSRGNCPLCNGFILEILDIF